VEDRLQDAKPLGTLDLKAQSHQGTQRDQGSRCEHVTRTPLQAVSAEDFLALKSAFVKSYSLKIEDQAYSSLRLRARVCVQGHSRPLPASRSDLCSTEHAERSARSGAKCLMRIKPKRCNNWRSSADYPHKRKRRRWMSLRARSSLPGGFPDRKAFVLQGGGGKGAGYPPCSRR